LPIPNSEFRIDHGCPHMTQAEAIRGCVGSAVGRILVVDDEESMRHFIRRGLARRGHQVTVAASAEEALLAMEGARFDVVFLDIRLPGRSGLEILPAALGRLPRPRVVIITGNSSLETAVKAVGLGASGYIEKPFSIEELAVLAAREVRAAEIDRGGRSPTAATEENLTGLLLLLDEIGRVARTDLPVLVHGEPGTEKEAVARAVHRLGPRCGEPFVPAFCGSSKSPEGPEKSLREAVGLVGRGTLFLDDVDELPEAAQMLLMRVLQENAGGANAGRGGQDAESDSRGGQCGLRLISATSTDLDLRVREGRFQRDLFFRIHVVPLAIPPLRDRPGEAVRLARRFLSEIAGPEVEFEEDALACLQAYPWPRNVWELRNVVERGAAMRAGNRIGAELLPPAVRVYARR
jgi:two-component system, NtrC family, nitrogen regulation response regulator GlnG